MHSGNNSLLASFSEITSMMTQEPLAKMSLFAQQKLIFLTQPDNAGGGPGLGPSAGSA